MARPATPEDIEMILDRLEHSPKFGPTLRTSPRLRRLLREYANESAAILKTPRTEVEGSLRWQLKRLLAD